MWCFPAPAVIMSHSAVSSYGLPELHIDPGDVSGSWNRFKRQFELDLRWRVIAGGKTKVKKDDDSEEMVTVFNDQLQSLALIKSVGQEGQDVLKAKGYNLSGDDLSYKSVLGVLSDHYEREESLNVKFMNFLRVQQLACEDNRDLSQAC